MKHPRISAINRARREGYAYGLTDPACRRPFTRASHWKIVAAWWAGFARAQTDGIRSEIQEKT